MALATGLPLLGINHLEGHIYSLWLAPDFSPAEFPVLALIVSGGHSELLVMRGHGVYQRIGGTIDDAAGEAFDKVGRLLGLPFPGGPAIEKRRRSLAIGRSLQLSRAPKPTALMISASAA